MADIKVPVLPESVTDAQVAVIHVKAGDYCEEGDSLIDLETDKVMLEVPATSSGTVEKVLVNIGDVVTANAPLIHINEQAKPPVADTVQENKEEKPVAPPPVKEAVSAQSPSVRQALFEHGVNASDVVGTGKSGRLTRQDVMLSAGGRKEERVPMSRLRARIAERLVEAQQNAAMLTTFNDVNMEPVMSIRSEYKEEFEKFHGVKLGFMSFFVKAAVKALQRFPSVNASIDGQDIIYHHYQDVGIAVSSDRGLVVPILRSCESRSMADIEASIMDYAKKAQSGSLGIDEITGGTFTISNGGIFGSMLSTPILNPPQSAILGMHRIEKRPVVINDEIKIKPMMYLALSYDHRIIDGKESVQFLAAIKQYLEDPARLLLEL